MDEDQGATRWSGWRIITGTTLLGFMVAALVSMLATPQYTATATTFVSVNGGDGTVDDAKLQESVFAQQRVKTYVDVARADEVMQSVIDDLGLPLQPTQLADRIGVSNPADTVALEISATDEDPELAQQIANSTAEQLSAYVAELETGTGGDPLVSITIIREATVPTSPSSPRTRVNVAIGLLVGLTAGGGAGPAGAASARPIRRRDQWPARPVRLVAT